MPGNRKPQRNGGFSNFVSDKVEVRRLNMKSSDKNGGVNDEPDQGAYPERPGEPDCIYYLRTGSCGYGSNCRFNHPGDTGGEVYNVNEFPERAGQPDCQFYMKTGTCKYGSTCKYHHPKDRQTDSLVILNIAGLPIRQDAKTCLHYMRTGLCKYGSACKFNHPQPATAPNVLPAPVYTSGSYAVAPSSNSPSVGEISDASLPKATYFYGSVLQVPQSYVPFYLSPSQGGNAYMGSVNPLSVSSIPSYNGQLSVSYLPERPDQPECRYFMNNGSCKYGSECKYHHPRDKISQFLPSSLGPMGLPLRPGHPICSYYSYYGLCKFGPTCRFDHPLDYSYTYSMMSVPSLATSYAASTPYQKIQSYETSPSGSPNARDLISKGEKTDKEVKLLNEKSLSLDNSDSPPESSTESSEIVSKESV